MSRIKNIKRIDSIVLEENERYDIHEKAVCLCGETVATETITEVTGFHRMIFCGNKNPDLIKHCFDTGYFLCINCENQCQPLDRHEHVHLGSIRGYYYDRIEQVNCSSDCNGSCILDGYNEFARNKLDNICPKTCSECNQIRYIDLPEKSYEESFKDIEKGKFGFEYKRIYCMNFYDSTNNCDRCERKMPLKIIREHDEVINCRSQYKEGDKKCQGQCVISKYKEWNSEGLNSYSFKSVNKT